MENIMEFFITENERSGTVYYEFQKGTDSPPKEYDWTSWKEDSILLSDENAFPSFFALFPNFDCYDITIITKEQWDDIVDRAKVEGGVAKKMIYEMMDWAEDNFKSSDYFRILGL